MTTQTPEGQYDVAIIGGGLVGASLAVLLDALTGSRPLRILVIEAMALPASPEPADADANGGLDVRTTALSRGSRHIYEQAGLWSSLQESAAAIRRVHVSDRGRFGAVRMDCGEAGVDALGYVLENRHLGSVLTRALRECGAVELCSPARVTALQPLPEGMRLSVATDGEDEPRSLDASLVVMADGGKSGLCDRMGISFRRRDYEQKALVSNIAFTRPHAGVAYERFTDQGPLAILPLPAQHGEHRGALIWTLPDEAVPGVLEMNDSGFLQSLQERFGNRLGRIRRAGKRSAFPLILSEAREQIRPGLALLGNVAHTLHPVAGQGLNLALRDAQTLAERILEAVREGRSPGEMAVLQRFLEARQADQAVTIAFSDYMTRLFSSNTPWRVWTRKFGLFSIDLLPPVKGLFARQAMGLADRNLSVPGIR